MSKFFGIPEGIHVGQQFQNRAELSQLYIHRPTQAGIHGNKTEGADSIVMSGGYPDDQDRGDYIIYTGHGGNSNKKQIADQSVDDSGNAGLITSFIQGFPVRVIRGHKLDSPYAPPSGFVFAGLYDVADYWKIVGIQGFNIVQFKLVRIPGQPVLITKVPPRIDPLYSITTVSRRIRDTALSRKVKEVYSHKCQVCDSSMLGVGGRRYSEGAHVRPLGMPHFGSDTIDNILCLCPNHHTELDLGGIVIFDDLTLARTSDMKPFAELTFRGKHVLEAKNVRYQREFWLKN